MQVLRKTKNYTVTGNGNTITIQVNEVFCDSGTNINIKERKNNHAEENHARR